ncbi:hypothetical protein BC628DRAFT_703459 [Trametes gibbosa]|nr:hypothetical protein BC628DRAFT_703459 [Trametes gibbosa]
MSDPATASNGTAAAYPPAGGKLPSQGGTLGALLLGSIFGFMLYGLMLHQAYRYYRMYPGDRRILKALVLIIIVTETFHTAMWITACYEYLVVNYFNPANAIKTHWYIKITIPVTAITIIFCQLFYAARVYYLGVQWQYRVLVGIVSTNTVEFSRSTWIISAAYGHAVLCDIFTTSALIYVLRRSRTGVKRTDSVLDTLVLYTVNTGLLTTIVGLLIFVSGIAYPDLLIYAGLSIAGVKLYSNSVLAMLNSRQSLSDRMTQGFESASFSIARFRHPTSTQAMTLDTWNARQIPVSLVAVTQHGTCSDSEGGTFALGPELGADDKKTALKESAGKEVDVETGHPPLGLGQEV